jgi:hypothetical protein
MAWSSDRMRMYDSPVLLWIQIEGPQLSTIAKYIRSNARSWQSLLQVKSYDHKIIAILWNSLTVCSECGKGMVLKFIL